MLEIHELGNRKGDLENQMRAMARKPELTADDDAAITTMRNELDDVEKRMILLRSAGDGEPQPTTIARNDPEATEYRSLVGRSNLGEILKDIYEQRAPSGPNAELQRHHGLGSNQIPLTLLRDPDNDVETRAITPAPGDHQTNQRPIVPAVYAMGDVAFLMIPQEVVAAGDAVFPIVTTRPTVGGPVTDTSSVAETVGSFSDDLLRPSRIQAEFDYLRTDAMRFPMMAESLRENLSMGLSEKIDAQMHVQFLTDLTQVTTSAATDFAGYRQKLVYAHLDGRYAMTEGDIRMCVAGDTIEDMSVKYRGNNADDSAIDSIRRISAGVMVSAHIAGVAATKQDVIVRRGTRQDAVVAVWDSATAVYDEITGSRTGEIKLTLVQGVAWKVTRPAGFARVQVQHGA